MKDEMENEIATDIKACPVCNTDWDFGYYDVVYYFFCSSCVLWFESHDGETLLDEMEVQDG